MIQGGIRRGTQTASCYERERPVKHFLQDHKSIPAEKHEAPKPAAPNTKIKKENPAASSTTDPKPKPKAKSEAASPHLCQHHRNLTLTRRRRRRRSQARVRRWTDKGHLPTRRRSFAFNSSTKVDVAKQFTIVPESCMMQKMSQVKERRRQES